MNAQGPGRGGRGGGASGAAQSEASSSTPATDRYPAPPAVETTSKTEHEITVNGHKIPYTATAGTMVLKKEDGKPWASMFYVAYSRSDMQDHSKWPITFSFNGGPGSASIWLHMGALGPRRVAMGPEGEQPKPP